MKDKFVLNSSGFNVPVVKRTRGYYIYGIDGARWTDLCLDNGSALLGHRPAWLTKVMKDTFNRGLDTPFPDIFSGRFIRALAAMLPQDFPFFRIYTDRDKIRKAVAVLNRGKITDPLLSCGRGRLEVWRYKSGLEPEISTEAINPVLPFPSFYSPFVLALREEPGKLLPGNDFIPGFTANSVSSAVGQLLQTAFPAAEKAFTGTDFESFGIYRVFKGTKAAYKKLYGQLIGEGLFLNPAWPCVNTAAAGLTEKEEKLFRKSNKKEGKNEC